MRKHSEAISIGLDWGSHHVKVVALAKRGDKITLIHCRSIAMSIDDPLRQQARLVRGLLQEMDLADQPTTMALPVSRTGVSPGCQSKSDETVDIVVDESDLRREWLPRMEAIGPRCRLEIAGQSLPALSSEQEERIYLNIGFNASQLTRFTGAKLTHHHLCDFGLSRLIPDEFRDKSHGLDLLFSSLNDDKLRHRSGSLCWTDGAPRGIHRNYLGFLEKKLTDFGADLQTTLQEMGDTDELSQAEIRVLGGGGLFQWLMDFLRFRHGLPLVALEIPDDVLAASPGPVADEIASRGSLYAQALALALAGCRAEERKGVDLDRAVRRFSSNPSRSFPTFRRMSLYMTTVILASYFGLSLLYSQRMPEYVGLSLQHQDTIRRMEWHNHLVEVDRRLSADEKRELLLQGPRLSTILDIMRQQIPGGVWIGQIRITALSAVDEPAIKDEKSDSQALVLHITGSGIAGHYVSEFYNRLYATGHFSKALVRPMEGKNPRDDEFEFEFYGTIKNEHDQDPSHS